CERVSPNQTRTIQQRYPQPTTSSSVLILLHPATRRLRPALSFPAICSCRPSVVAFVTQTRTHNGGNRRTATPSANRSTKKTLRIFKSKRDLNTPAIAKLVTIQRRCSPGR